MDICGIASNSGRHGEPLLCGLPKGHAGAHAWADLPTFRGYDNMTETEHAARALLFNIYEFDTVSDGIFLDALDRALRHDVPEDMPKID